MHFYTMIDVTKDKIRFKLEMFKIRSDYSWLTVPYCMKIGTTNFYFTDRSLKTSYMVYYEIYVKVKCFACAEVN